MHNKAEIETSMFFMQHFPPRTATMSCSVCQQHVCDGGPHPARGTRSALLKRPKLFLESSPWHHVCVNPWRLLFLQYMSFWSSPLCCGYRRSAVACLPLLLMAGAWEAASWQDIPALCQVAGEQVLFDAPLTLRATAVQPVVVFDWAAAQVWPHLWF